MRHKANIITYQLLEVEDNILNLPFIDFSKLPDKYGKDNFIGFMDYHEINLLSWEDLVKCWDKEVRFYFDGSCYDKIDDFTHIIVKDTYGYDSLHEYLTGVLIYENNR